MMRRNVIEPGTQFGQWVVLEGQENGEHPRCLCVCGCGTFQRVYSQHLKNGASKGCRVCALVTHGLSYSDTFKSWGAMRTRCTNPKHPKFHLYGGRGITVCEKWRTFAGFLEDMGERPEGKTLERIDGDKGYSKENCKWATIIEQNSNRANNAFVLYEGERYTVAALARHLGLSYATVWFRVKKGQKLDAPQKKRKMCQ